MRIGNWDVVDVLGQGASATVYLGKHYKTGRQVAMKCFFKEILSCNKKKIKRMRREVALLRLLDHPHIIKLYEVVETKKKVFLILEHAAGGDLFDYITRRGRLGPKESKRIVMQVVSALMHCQEFNVSHLDIKPENIFLDKNNNVKLGDFGMAVTNSSKERFSLMCGSRSYMSPEVVLGKYKAKSADIWSLGIVLYGMICGFTPFDNCGGASLMDSICKVRIRMPPKKWSNEEMNHLLTCMLNRDAEKRIQLSHLATQLGLYPISSTPFYQDNRSKDIDYDVVEDMTILAMGDHDNIVKALSRTSTNHLTLHYKRMKLIKDHRRAELALPHRSISTAIVKRDTKIRRCYSYPL